MTEEVEIGNAEIERALVWVKRMIDAHHSNDPDVISGELTAVGHEVIEGTRSEQIGQVVALAYASGLVGTTLVDAAALLHLAPDSDGEVSDIDVADRERGRRDILDTLDKSIAEKWRVRREPRLPVRPDAADARGLSLPETSTPAHG